jgi:hypothetical protein
MQKESLASALFLFGGVALEDDRRISLSSRCAMMTDAHAASGRATHSEARATKFSSLKRSVSAVLALGFGIALAFLRP